MRIGTTKLDLYIIKKFLTTFVGMLAVIIIIVIIFDISEKIDDFVDKEAPLKAIIFQYYMNFIPYFINMFSPLFVFITVIFFTSKLAQDTEIIAMLSGGMSFRRLMVPYLISATLIFSLSLSLNLYVIPSANKVRLEFEQHYLKGRHDYNSDRNIHYQLSPGEFLYVESFSTWNNTAFKFTLESIDHNQITSKLSAQTAKWDSDTKKWHLKKYFLRTYENNKEVVKYGEEIDTLISITALDFDRKKHSEESLTRKELNDLIATQTLRGDKMVQNSLIEKHTRTSMPFSAFILTVMGVSLGSKKRRGGIGFNLGLGIGLSFSYILFMKFSQMFVFTDTLAPGLAIWLPNIIYACIAFVLYKLAPK